MVQLAKVTPIGTSNYYEITNLATKVTILAVLENETFYEVETSETISKGPKVASMNPINLGVSCECSCCGCQFGQAPSTYQCIHCPQCHGKMGWQYAIWVCGGCGYCDTFFIER